MIKINRDFDKLANEHVDGIKSRLGIEKRIKGSINDSIKNSKGRLIEFYKFVEANLNEILGSDICYLSSVIIPNINCILGADYFTATKKNKNNRPEKINKDDIKEIIKTFNYSTFSQKDENNYDAYTLIKKLNIKTCPYCNLQNIHSVFPSINKKSSRPAFDHFYSKYEYPYLALSFWNLIPSCSTCNKLKHTYMVSMHPYVVGFEGILKFSTIINDYNDLNILKEQNDLELKLIKSSTKTRHMDVWKASLNVDIFLLNDFYNNHTDFVQDLIKKSYIYSDSRINEILNLKIFKNEDEVYRTVFSNYYKVDDFEKRILSKLTFDIAKEHGLLEKFGLERE